MAVPCFFEVRLRTYQHSPVSAKKFGIFERIRKFNFYIHVQKSNDPFTNSFTSDSYTERLFLIFLKWAIPNMWSSIQNVSRSSLYQSYNFTVPEDVQYVGGTISNSLFLILSNTSCVWANFDGANLGRCALPSKTCTNKRQSIVKLKNTTL